MAITSWPRSVLRAVSLRTDSPELVQAQCAALSQQVPMAYLILIINAWMVSSTFADQAPLWLAIGPSLLLSVVCVSRLFAWWRIRGKVLTAERALRELRRAILFTAGNSVGILVCAFALYPYGDMESVFHLTLCMALTAIGIMLCMTQLASAALIVALVVGGGSVAMIAMMGTAVFGAIAINIALVFAAVVVIMLIQNRNFTRMVDAQTSARLRELEQSRLLHMIDDMPVAVMTVEPGTLNINYVNETSKQMVGRIEHLLPIKAEALLGASIDIFHRYPEHQRRILADPGNLPHRARIHLGPEVLDLQVSAITDDEGRYLGPMLAWSIVTKEVEAENRIRHLAHYDTLTGLPNRNSFRERLSACLLGPGAQIGLLYVDLDGFKMINDTRGHGVGDALLRQVAERLRSACEGKGISVARLGGDEFAVLLPYEDRDQAEELACKLLTSLSEPYHLDHDRHVRIGASVGIALAPVHGEDGDTLLSRADIALYAAKAAGKGVARTFTAEMEARVQERVRLEGKLRIALESREGLFVFYQPIIDIQTGRVTAREAVARWHHPMRGWISPAEFVPVAEDCGLIEELGQFVLDCACRDAAGWQDVARVAVNVSPGQLGKGSLTKAVQAALADSGLPSDRLEVEVTETALLAHECDGVAELRQLRAMGVRIALDDFGTGYSSLAHLRIFPFDKIKIDGSFVRDAVERPDCAAVVRAVAELGRRLGVTTVAEGVETQAHLERIRAEGCREAQGYLFSRPMPSEHDRSVVEALDRIGHATRVGVTI